ncbi:MAG TPA: VCBS repeat-containing protein [Myxococcota bacterium]|nr:VCBS repeat-containing protein [Myxococcota bacterium]HRY94482.1 VCBS repeat-containing protein [Myxococcota bacterium]HSA20070.1 VCBS repeat-containing protein [Myxococcota bacterium]
MRSLKSPVLILCALACGLAADRARATDCDHNTRQDEDDIAIWGAADCDADGALDVCEIFPLSYAGAGRTPLGVGPAFLAAGDVDADGVTDLVATLGEGALPVIVLRGDGAGGFQPSQAFAGPSSPQGLRLADLDGDGRPEVLVTSYDGLSVLPNLGGGSLGAAVLYPPLGALPPGALAVADLDGDAGATLDVISAVWAEDRLEIRLNQGDGTLLALPSLATCATPSGLAAGDLDGDADADVVVICTGGAEGEAQVLRNDGLAGLELAGSYPAGSLPSSPLLADLDGDGDLDLALVHDMAPGVDDPSKVRLLRNDGLGSFGASELFATGWQPHALIAADLDADGDLDLVSADMGGDTLTVLENSGAGDFHASVSFESGVRPVGLAALDLDADGALELASLEDPFPNPDGGLTLLARVPPREADEDGDGVPDVCGAPTSLEPQPDTGGDIGLVTVWLRGGSFAPGSVVELRRAGQTSLEAWSVAEAADGRSARVTFDLRGVARGAWDVAVESAGSPLQLCAGCFTVEAGVPPRLWTELLGRMTVRVDYEQGYTLVLGNLGNVDAVSLVIWLHLPPGCDFTSVDPLERPWPPGGEPSGYSPESVPVSFPASEGGGAVVPIYKPLLPPGRPWEYRFRLRPRDEGASNLGVTVSSLRPEPGSDGEGDCVSAVLDALAAAALEKALGIALGSECLTGVASNAISTMDALEQDAREAPEGADRAFQAADMTMGWLSAGLSCAGTVVPELKLLEAAIAGLQLLSTGAQLLAACGGLLGSVGSAFLAVLAMDPNELSGPPGAGPERDLRGDSPFAYTVTFENLATASAPAQEVRVRVPFPAELDPASLALGPAGFGERLITPEQGGAGISTRVDLRPAQELLVEVQAGYDAVAGELAWTFRSLDPATLAPPDDPLAGFLPPDVNHPAGEGFVTFWASARPGLATGDRIAAAAEIVFDANAPIATNTWSNRIDLDPPVTTLAPLAAESPATFELAWTVADEGAGHADTTVLVSSDGGAEEVWLYRAPGLAATFQGEPGSCYSFRARSRDLAWNEEAAPSQAVETCVAEAEDGGFWDCACGAGRPEGLLGLLGLLAALGLRRRG